MIFIFSFWLELAVIVICLAIGGRFSGIGLGVAGGFGLAILTLGFGLPVGEMPTSVVFIIMTVITCVSLLQGAGGLDYMISMAEKILRKKPSAITFLGPLVSYIFTVICGTSYVAFSVYPVIAEIAINAKVRPERAMSMSVIASNMAVCASPTSAIAAAMIAITAPIGVTPLSLLAVTVPACLIGVLVGCLFVYKRGAELADDPEFKRRVATGQFQEDYVLERDTQNATTSAKVSVVIFLLAIAIIVGMTSHPDLLPNIGPGGKPISVPTLLQIMMLATGAIIMVVCRVPRDKLDSGSVFKSGLIGAVGILGISWMTDTFFATHLKFITDVFAQTLIQYPMIFGAMLFVTSMVLYSPAATAVALMPIGVSLGLPAEVLIGLIPATCAVFIIPGGAQISCVAFDRTGTTKIGRFGFNHSYLIPGLVSMAASTVLSLAIAYIIF